MNTPSPSPVSGWEAERERLRKALERIKSIANDRSDPAGFRLGMIADEAHYALSESKEQTTAEPVKSARQLAAEAREDADREFDEDLMPGGFN